MTGREWGTLMVRRGYSAQVGVFQSSGAMEGEGMVSHGPWSSRASTPAGLSSRPGAGVQGQEKAAETDLAECFVLE